MDFVGEVEIKGEIYISYNALSFSKKVDMERLKDLIRSDIDVYVYDIGTNWDEDIVMIKALKALNPKQAKDLMRNKEKVAIACSYDPLILKLEPDGWKKTYFSKKELEKHGLIPSADDNRKEGLSKAIKESMERSLQATYLVGKWIGEAGLQPGGITKIKVQDFLGQNNFGFGETTLFKDVWKAIPHSDKSTGGRPPNI
jgi:hypothetical protein